MRLAATTKNGFFPADPKAIEGILKHLKMPDPPDPKKFRPDDITILDPCAGEGHAIAQFAEGLGIDRSHTYAIELNAARAGRIRENYPGINLLGPCSFHACTIEWHSFSLIYCNPPFDSEFGGGGREEVSFVSRCIDMVAIGGVLVLVCPQDQVWKRQEMINLLDTYFQDIECYSFPDDVRKYGELVTIGRRRKQPVPKESLSSSGVLNSRGAYRCYGQPVFPALGEPQYEKWMGGRPVELSRKDEIDTWTLPHSWKPRRFLKTELTAEEIEASMAKSQLWKRFTSNRVRTVGRPPMSLNRGHVSLQLLSGLLDGYVPSDPPHVVRGYCGKVWSSPKVEEHTTEDGTHVEKKIFSELPNPIVRAVWPDGNIKTLSDKKPVAADQEQFDLVESDEVEESDE